MPGLAALICYRVAFNTTKDLCAGVCVSNAFKIPMYILIFYSWNLCLLVDRLIRHSWIRFHLYANEVEI